MSEAIKPSIGRGVVHLFCKPTPLLDGDAVVAAVRAAEGEGCQVVAVSTLGHLDEGLFLKELFIAIANRNVQGKICADKRADRCRSDRSCPRTGQGGWTSQACCRPR